MRLISLAALLLLPQDDIAKHKKELEDGAYGNLWDRKDAAKALGRIGSKEAAQVLIDFCGRGDPATREAVILALASIRDDGVRSYVRDKLSSLPSPAARADVLRALRRMEWTGCKDTAHAQLKDKSPEVRIEAILLLETLKDARCAEAIKDSTPEVAEQALLSSAALKAGDLDAVRKRAKEDAAPRVQAAALRCWAAHEAVELDPFVKASKPEPRIAAADVATTVPPLKTLLDDKDWRVRVAAVAGLERVWTVEAVEALVERLLKEDGRLVLDIILALREMTQKDLGFEPKAWKSWWDSNRESFQMPERPKSGGRKGEVKGGGNTVSSFFNVPILSKRVVFIIDCSGSMKSEDEIYKGKRKIDVAMEELQKAVALLPADARVGVIMLSTEATAQKLRSTGAQLVALSSGRNRPVDFMKQAWGKLENIKRGRGDIYDAVLEAQGLPEADTVLLLTDGVPTDGKYSDRQNFLEGIATEYRYRRVCVHAILIGSRGIDPKLMEGTADRTGGIYMPRK